MGSGRDVAMDETEILCGTDTHGGVASEHKSHRQMLRSRECNMREGESGLGT